MTDAVCLAVRANALVPGDLQRQVTTHRCYGGVADLPIVSSHGPWPVRSLVVEPPLGVDDAFEAAVRPIMKPKRAFTL